MATSSLRRLANGSRIVKSFKVTSPNDTMDTCCIIAIEECDNMIVMADFMNKSVKLFNSAMQFVNSIHIPGNPIDLCLSKGQVFAVCLNDPCVYIFDISNSCLVGQQYLWMRGIWYCWGVSRCGKHLAISVSERDDCQVWLIDSMGHRLKHFYTGSLCGSLSPFPNSNHLAMVNDNIVLFIDTEKGECTETNLGDRKLSGVVAAGDEIVFTIDSTGAVNAVWPGYTNKIKDSNIDGRRPGQGICFRRQYDSLMLQQCMGTDTVEMYQLVYPDAEDCLSHMQAGSLLMDVRSPSKHYHWFFVLSQDMTEISWKSVSEKPAISTRAVSSITEIRCGKTTDALRYNTEAWFYPDGCAFSIVFQEYDDSMDLVANTLHDAYTWVTGLARLVNTTLPPEITRLDERSVELYTEALAEGSTTDNSIRVIIVGPAFAGKTTLTRRLLKLPVDSEEGVRPEECLDVHTYECRVNLNDGNCEWDVLDTDEMSVGPSRRITKLLKEESDKRRLAVPIDSGNKRQQHQEHDKCEVGERSAKVQQPSPATNKGQVYRFVSWLLLGPSDKRPSATRSGQEQQSSVKRDGTCKYSSSDVSKNSAQKQSRVKVQQASPESTDLKEIIPSPDDVRDQSTNMKPVDTRITKEIQELIMDVTSDPTVEAEVSVLDLDCQSVFYSTHQEFLSPRAVYILVTDMTRKMNDSGRAQSYRISDSIEFWLNSVAEYCPTDGVNVPQFIIVGTKANQVNSDDREGHNDKYFKDICNLPSVKKNMKQIAEEQFAIETSAENDPNVIALKQKIVEIASKQPYWGARTPAKWIYLEKALSDMCRKGTKILKKVEVVSIADSLPIAIDAEDIEAFLHAQHQLGKMMYFSQLGFTEHVLLEPRWLVEAINCVITFNETSRHHLNQTELLDKLEEFEQTAMLDTVLMDAIWSCHQEKGFIKHKYYLISLMERLHLLARLHDNDNDDEGNGAASAEEDDRYLVPFHLNETPTLEIFSSANPESSTEKLCLTFPNQFFPVAIFNQLLAACASKWTIARRKEKRMVFSGCAIFAIDCVHSFTLYYLKQAVQLWVTTFSKNGLPQTSVCEDILKYVLHSLDQARHGLVIEQYIKCPHTSLDRLEGLFKVTELKEKGGIVCPDHGHHEMLTSSVMLRGWCEPDVLSQATRHNQSQEGAMEKNPVQKRVGSKEKKLEKQDSFEQHESEVLEKERKFEKQASFQLYENEVLGKGAACDVFKGSYHNRPVAVKRILYTDPTNEEDMKREMLILNQLEKGRHENIIGFYLAERHVPYLYLILELCDGTLVDYLKPENSHWRDDRAPSQVSKCMADGLSYLHSNNIVHRDLKPQNVLFSLNGKGISKVCLADFGMAKTTQDGAFSVSGTFGTDGYRAPESYDSVGGRVKAESCDNRSDIFSLGILICYTYSEQHPFGNPISRQMNILKGKMCLKELFRIDHTCGNLVEAMLQPDPSKRPEVGRVCEHPVFWDDEYVKEFFNTISDALESDRKQIPWQQLDDHCLIPGNNWVIQLPPFLQNYIATYTARGRNKLPVYQGNEASIYYLLRAIRNTNHHFEIYPEDVKKELGPFPSGHMKVWKSCCPKLLLHLYNSLPSKCRFNMDSLPNHLKYSHVLT